MEMELNIVNDLEPEFTFSGSGNMLVFAPEDFSVYLFEYVGSGMPMAVLEGTEFSLGSLPRDLAGGEQVEDVIRNLAHLLNVVRQDYLDGQKLSQIGQDGLDQVRALLANQEWRTKWSPADWYFYGVDEDLDEVLELVDRGLDVEAAVTKVVQEVCAVAESRDIALDPVEMREFLLDAYDELP